MMLTVGRPKLVLGLAFVIFIIFISLLQHRALVSDFATNDIPGYIQSYRGSQEPAQWLIATSSPVENLQRRQIIRATWPSMFKNDSLYDHRFILARPPSDDWIPVLQKENDTHQDLIILYHIEESSRIANTVKTVELLKHLTADGMRKYRFVSKIDDDSFLDPNAFYREYLAPIESMVMSKGPKQLMAIARKLTMGEYKYPGGQFYTLTWALARTIASLHNENPIEGEHEDVLVGRLLYESRTKWNLTSLPNKVAFDYDDDLGAVEDGRKTAWAVEGADLTAPRHAVGPGAINPHKMRKDLEYLRVAACYDENGLKRTFAGQ